MHSTVSESSSDSFEAAGSSTTELSSFNPIYLLSQWTEPSTTTRRLSVASLLPSGVSPGKFRVRVMPGGRVLELVVEWPAPLTDLRLLHKKWIAPLTADDRIETYHPKFLGFEAALKSHPENLKDKVESPANIALQISVQTHIEQRINLGWFDQTARVIYIDLKANEDNYGLIMPHDDNSFEIV